MVCHYSFCIPFASLYESKSLKIMKKFFDNNIIVLLIGAVIFIIASIYITFPLILHLGTLTTGLADELLIAWIHGWVMHSLLSGNIFLIFDANIYYPYQNSLAYSDTFFVTSLFSFLITNLIGQPIAANNIIIIFGLALLGFSIYILSYYLTKDYGVSLFSGLLVVFSPAVLDKRVHVQILAIAGVPFALFFFIYFLNKKKSRYLLLSLLCFLLQTYNSFMPGYFILFSYVIILGYYYFEKKKMKYIFTKKNVLMMFTSLLLLIPIILPYYKVSNEFNYTRDIRESVHLALQPEDLFYTSIDSRLVNLLNNLPFNKMSQNNEFKPGYLGFIFTLALIFSIWYFFRKMKKKQYYSKSFMTIGFVGLILSFGPLLHLGRQTVHDPFLIPLPYALFYYIIPGFQGIRNSARWEMLFILAMAIVIALIFHLVTKKYSLRRKIFLYSTLILFTIAEFNFPMQFINTIPQKKDFPKVYSWIATTPPESIFIEMPIYTWDMQPYVFAENMREYYSTIHYKKMVNGASGYSPEPWMQMVRKIMSTFPSKDSVNILRSLKVDYIILHKSEYDRLEKDKVIIQERLFKNGEQTYNELMKNEGIELINKFGEDYVIKIQYNE